MQPDVDFLVFCDIGNTRLRPDVKADDDDRRACFLCLCRRSKENVGLVDRSYARADHPDLDLVCRKFFERSLENLDGALDVGLKNDEQLLDLGKAE